MSKVLYCHDNADRANTRKEFLEAENFLTDAVMLYKNYRQIFIYRLLMESGILPNMGKVQRY